MNPLHLVLHPALLLALIAAPPVFGQSTGPTPVSFHNGEMLHTPTHAGVTLSLLPAEPCLLYVVYGNARLGSRHTQTLQRRPGQLATFVLDGLQADDEYSYSVLVKRPGERAFQSRGEHGFRTLHEPGSTFSFGVMADSHAFAVWSTKNCAGGPALAFDRLSITLDNLKKDADLDFVVNGTDHAMTLCSGGCKTCTIDGMQTTAASVDSEVDAMLRYRTVFSPAIFGHIGPDLPMLLMLGDHDGELGWGGPGTQGLCAASQAATEWSTRQRLAHVPNPHDAYGERFGGSPTGNYYALETGDLLLVVLDPGRHTTAAPASPLDFTLGPQQLDWLEATLAASHATFKVVFSEHLLGGQSNAACWKGRGGLRATTNGEINGPFLGEQFVIHELLKQYGAQVFFSFHDHVVVFGEKVDENFVGEGVTYVLGGRASGVSNGWANQDWYKTAMDYDGDGVPEYLTGVTGTKVVGHFKVTVHGAERMDFEYLRSHETPGVNGSQVLSFSIFP